jgi:hypothetical protein
MSPYTFPSNSNQRMAETASPVLYDLIGVVTHIGTLAQVSPFPSLPSGIQ